MLEPCSFYSGRNITYPATRQHSKLLAEQALQLGLVPVQLGMCCILEAVSDFSIPAFKELTMHSGSTGHTSTQTPAHLYLQVHANGALSLLVVFDFSFLKFPPPQGHHTLISQQSVVEDLCSKDLRQVSVLQFPPPECGDNRTYSWGYYEN